MGFRAVIRVGDLEVHPAAGCERTHRRNSAMAAWSIRVGGSDRGMGPQPTTEFVARRLFYAFQSGIRLVDTRLHAPGRLGPARLRRYGAFVSRPARTDGVELLDVAARFHSAAGYG